MKRVLKWRWVAKVSFVKVLFVQIWWTKPLTKNTKTKRYFSSKEVLFVKHAGMGTQIRPQNSRMIRENPDPDPGFFDGNVVKNGVLRQKCLFRQEVVFRQKVSFVKKGGFHQKRHERMNGEFFWSKSYIKTYCFGQERLFGHKFDQKVWWKKVGNPELRGAFDLWLVIIVLAICLELRRPYGTALFPKNVKQKIKPSPSSSPRSPLSSLSKKSGQLMCIWVKWPFYDQLNDHF